MCKLKEICILFAGGGTGGHLFPALAVAQELRDRFGESFKAFFTGRADKIEGKSVPKHGFNFIPIDVEGFVRSKGLRNLAIPFKLLRAESKLRAIIDENNIKAVVATGAYISVAPVRAAFSAKIPAVLMESNVNPGKALKMLSTKADIICTSFSESADYFPEKVKSKIRVTGNPVRKELLDLPTKAEACQKYQLNPDKPIVLVFGGSLGARSINHTIEKNAVRFDDAGIQIIWQTGSMFNTVMPELSNIRIRTFIDDMSAAYAAADLVLSRSGATTVAELAVTGKPSILIPLPSASNREQHHNAEIFTNHGAAVMYEDNEIGDLIFPTITNMLSDGEKLSEMAQNAKQLAKNDAAKITADLILQLIRQ